jgi:CRISP-associated protein Cas1
MKLIDQLSYPWLSSGSLLSAWEHVYENGGCAGADAVSLEHFGHNLDSEIEELQRQVERGEYHPLPLFPITVQKKPHSPEVRVLMVPTVRDRVLQTTVGRHLGRAFEDEFLDCSFAYRPHRSVDSAIARIRFWRDHGFQFVADADIEAFFDRVDHAVLRQRLATRLNDPALCLLVEKWIAGPIWDGTRIRPLARRIPQGSPISPLLANFFLSDFDLAVETSGMKLIRYADDFLILARDQECATSALSIAREKLEELHLALKAEKTKITSFEEGFDFLGVFFRARDIWVPWGKHDKNRRVLAIPRRMPAALVRRFLSSQSATAMQVAFAAALRKPEKDMAQGTANEGEEMAYLYLTEQGSVLRKIGNRLVVEKQDEILLDAPYHKLEAVLLFGNVQVTTQAMTELLDCGIPVSFLDRGGRLRGGLEPTKGKNIPLRIAQFDLFRDVERSMAMARVIVDAKLANSAEVLASFGDRMEARSPATAAALSQIELARQAARTAATHEVLNGTEGATARLYFDVLMRRNKSALSWPGRIKHPATDPINSLLSFGYTLVARELAGLLEGVGL